MRAVLSGSTLFAILFWFLTETLIWDSDSDQIQRWNCPLDKLSDEMVIVKEIRIFVTFAPNVPCGYSLESLHWGSYNYTNPQDIFEPEHEKTCPLTCAPNEDSDQPAHPHSLIRVFVVCEKTLCSLCYRKCAQWRVWSDCANAQADLNLRSAHMSEGVFSNVLSGSFAFSVIILSGVVHFVYQ